MSASPGSGGAAIIIVVAPAGEDDASFLEGVEQLAVGAVGQEKGVEGLGTAILEGATELDIDRFDAAVF